MGKRTFVAAGSVAAPDPIRPYSGGVPDLRQQLFVPLGRWQITVYFGHAAGSMGISKSDGLAAG
jgi:hypothetical protein